MKRAKLSAESLSADNIWNGLMGKKHALQKPVAPQAEAILQSCSSSRRYALTEIKPKHSKYSVSLMRGISLITIAVGVGLPMQAQAQAVNPPCDAGHANTGCYITSTPATLTNTGIISGADYGVLNSGNNTIITNSSGGRISSGLTGSTSIGWGISNSGTISALSNSGVISGDYDGITNNGAIGSLINTGTIEGSTGADGIYNQHGTIGTLSNSGTISGHTVGIGNFAGTIGTLTNSGTIRGVTASGMFLNGSSTIGTLTNSGMIIGDDNGISIFDGNISTLTNTGTISGGDYGINNDRGTISTLNNLQGASGSALTFTGTLPTNYNIMINGPSNYGQLRLINTTSGTMAFGIYNGSGLQYGTYKYAGALQNFGSTLSTYLSSGITGTGTDGIFRSYNWSFAEGSTGNWDLIVSTSLTPFSTVAKNINQRNVGNALTVAALGSVSALGAPILNALYYGNYQNAQAVMDTVGGSGLAGVQSTAMQVGEMASSSVSDQIAFWRSGETMDATGRTSQEGNNPRNFLAYAPVQRNVSAKGPINLKGPAGSLTAAVAPRTFRAWGSMFGGGANYLSDAGRGAAASNIGYYGGLIGVDYQIQPNILVGVALGGSSSNFNVGSLSTNGNLTGFHAGVYGAYTMGNSYVALNETFSAYNNQTSRKAGGYAYMPYEQLSAQFGSTEFRTRTEVGHGVLMGGLKATPFVAAEIAAYQSNAFSEQSSIYASTFALKNNGQGINSLPTFAGLRLSNAVTLSNGWRLAPVGSVAYVHEFFPQRQFNNILMSMPGADFNVAGPRSTYNLVQTKVGAQLNLNEKLALFTDFQGEFSPVSQSYGGKGGVKYVW